MRLLGSGGPGMDAASSLRRSIRKILELLKANTRFLLRPSSASDARPEYLKDIPDAIRYLQSSVERLGASLSEFVGVFYNEKLMRLLGRLKESLKGRLESLDETKQTISDLQKYLHIILRDLTTAFEMLTVYLADFVDKGLCLLIICQVC